MSLVINSNDIISSWNRQSNYFLDTYPNFSQILIKPMGLASWWNKDTSANTVADINWTKINLFSAMLNESRFYIWNSVAWDYGSPWQVQIWSWTVSWNAEITLNVTLTRLWCPFTFVWWEIVWKQVYWNWFLYTYDNNNTNYFISWEQTGLIMTTQLLHSDWTLTNVNTWNVRIVWAWSGRNATGEIFSQSSWWVAQAWDMIVVSISWTIKVHTTWNISARTTYFWLLFWYDWTTATWIWWSATAPTCPCRPIQISIE